MTSSEYPDNFDDLLDRYVGGECTPAEAAFVARWLDADPASSARRERLERLRGLWEASRRPAAGPPETWDVDGAWRRAAARMAPAKILMLTPPGRQRQRRTAWIPALRAAAVVFAVGGVAAGWMVVSKVLPANTNTGVVSAAREYVTPRGTRAILMLDDGTRVTLGAASKLTVPPGYGSAGARLVTLQGEGYFEVVHDTARPFSVRAGRGLVRDIGTKFVVRAYAPDQPVAVAVTEGEVLLAGARLRQGDLGRLDPAGAVQVRRGADLRGYTSWTEGRLVFDDTPLAEAVPVIERWYDLEITVADSALYHRRLFATLEDQSVASVLDLMALSLDLRVKRRGRAVTLSK